MPIPTPSEGEDRSAFISRCIKEYPDEGKPHDQVVAACYSQYKGESMHPDFTRILGTFVNFFKDGSGADRFSRFVESNKLNPSLPYDPRIQFRESFQWTEPLIQFLKREENDAKFYKVRALTANVSMNNNDYRDYQRKFVQSENTLTFKPVDINHDHSRWQPFPSTRVEMAHSEDLAMELVLRVGNDNRWLQGQLDSGQILHPSIEAYQNADGTLDFIGLALIEKGVELPGDPLTEIVPFILNESLRSKLCKVVDGKVVCDINDLRGEKRIMEKDRLAESSMLTEMQLTVEKAFKENQKLREDINREITVKNQSVKDRDFYKEKVSAFEEKVASLEKQVEEAKNEKTKLFSDSQVRERQLFEEKAKAVEEGQTKLKLLFDESQAKDKTILVLKQDTDRLVGERDGFKIQLMETVSDRNRLEDSLREAQKVMRQSNEDRKAAIDENINLGTMNQALHEEARKLQIEIVKLGNTVREKDKELGDLRTDKASNEDKDDEVRKQLKITQERFDRVLKTMNEKGLYLKDQTNLKESQ